MLEISFPPDPLEQSQRIERIISAQRRQHQARQEFKTAMAELSNLIDGRGDEELPEVLLDENEIDVQERSPTESR
jgi:hypothetical protein